MTVSLITNYHRALATSKKGIPDYCSGFWKDYRHLAAQFQYLTEVPPLTETVERKLKPELERLEIFLKDQCKTLDFQEKLEEIERKCALEHSGSSLPKDIFLLVCVLYLAISCQ